MPTVLSDPSPTFYVILIVIVAGLAFLAMRSQKRGDLIRLHAGAGVLLAVFLIDKFVESPREESTRKVQEMSAASKAKNIDDVARHVSDSFEFDGMSKEQLLAKFKTFYAVPEFNGIDVTGLSRNDFEPIDNKNVKVRFEVWPAGYGAPAYRYECWATFVKDGDGQYRMRTFVLSQQGRTVVPSQLR